MGNNSCISFVFPRPVWLHAMADLAFTYFYVSAGSRLGMASELRRGIVLAFALRTSLYPSNFVWARFHCFQKSHVHDRGTKNTWLFSSWAELS